MRSSVRVLKTVLVLAAIGCARSPSQPPTPLAIWYVPAPQLSNAVVARFSSSDPAPGLGTLVGIDSTSFRPTILRRGGSGYMETKVADSAWAVIHPVRPAFITTWQGQRYHPEIIRTLAMDTTVLASAADRLMTTVGDARVILDFQAGTPDDIPELVDVVRSIGAALRNRNDKSIALVVPAEDTVAYPTAVLARVADVLVLRLHGEHRPGTAAGPLATPEWITRAIGTRARVAGASRLGAELALFGYIWQADGSAAPITFADAQSLVRAEAGVFTRDPPSGFLTARGRDGWTIWVPDAATVKTMAEGVRRRGIRWIALAGPEGADPLIFSQRLR
jgi:hypothetical protein